MHSSVEDAELHKLRNACQQHRNTYSLNALAAALRRRGHLDDAKSLHSEALALQENHASWVGLAAVYCDGGLVRKAKQILDRVVKEKPQDSHAWLCLARVYSELDEQGKADRCRATAEACERKASPKAPGSVI